MVVGHRVKYEILEGLLKFDLSLVTCIKKYNEL